MSAIEPTGTGARTATPSNRLAKPGTARVVARAAPVVGGTRLAAPARPRRYRRLGPSTIRWPPVYAWMVVMVARSTPIRRWATSMTGVMQLVVQLAQETIFGWPSARLTPCTTVGTVSDLVGAESTTYEAPAWMCLVRSSSVVNRSAERPVG